MLDAGLEPVPKAPTVKIIQMLAMTDDDHWRSGEVLGLGDNGVVYRDVCHEGTLAWEVYIPLKFSGT